MKEQYFRAKTAPAITERVSRDVGAYEKCSVLQRRQASDAAANGHSMLNVAKVRAPTPKVRFWKRLSLAVFKEAPLRVRGRAFYEY